MTIRPKLTAAAFALLAGGLSACEGGMASLNDMNPFVTRAATETFIPIATEEAFRAEVVGREVVYANGAIGTYGADNTWSIATEDGVLASGTWAWSDGQWCYQGATAGDEVETTCQAVAVSDTGVRFTRADGTEGVLPFRG